jgi:hypothetical protein
VESTSEPIDSVIKPSSEGLVPNSSPSRLAGPGSEGVLDRPGIWRRASERVPSGWRESMAGRFTTVRFALTV